MPPSAKSSTLVMKLDASLARNTAALPISRGSASRPIGFASPIDLTAASTLSAPDADPRALLRDGVSTGDALAVDARYARLLRVAGLEELL